MAEVEKAQTRWHPEQTRQNYGSDYARHNTQCLCASLVTRRVAMSMRRLQYPKKKKNLSNQDAESGFGNTLLIKERMSDLFKLNFEIKGRG